MPATCTPEGQPIQCCVCQRTVIVEPSRLANDVCCPCCGSLNWMAELTVEDWLVAQELHRRTQQHWLRRALRHLRRAIVGRK